METSEGHTVEDDEEGSVIGLELINVRSTLECEGTLKLTWPQAELTAEQLDPVVTSP